MTDKKYETTHLTYGKLISLEDVNRALKPYIESGWEIMPSTSSWLDTTIPLRRLIVQSSPPKPLTIDKRVKGEILCMMSDQGTALDKFITIEDYLDSLEET